MSACSFEVETTSLFSSEVITSLCNMVICFHYNDWKVKSHLDTFQLYTRGKKTGMHMYSRSHASYLSPSTVLREAAMRQKQNKMKTLTTMEHKSTHKNKWNIVFIQANICNRLKGINFNFAQFRIHSDLYMRYLHTRLLTL